MVRDHGTIEINLYSGSGLCVLCDNAVEEGLEGLVFKDGHVYLAHGACIEVAWEEQEEEKEE